MEEDCDDEDDDYSDEEDEEMPDDDVPEDSMTLVQYLEEARREALIRKGSQYSDVSTKKGRLENCRGISAIDTSSGVLRLIRKFNPIIVCLVETHANSDRVDRFCNKVPKHWEWTAILANGFSGGIFVLWNKAIGKVTPIVVSRRVLHIIISSASSKSFIISVVYNSVRFQKQCLLWNELSKITCLRIPWLILGDFNSVLSRSKHKGGSFSYYSRKSRLFLDFVDSNNLLDLKYTGSPYTWCNNQFGSAHRWARLDRCLVNVDWLASFKSYNLKHLTRSFSDHSPLFLSASFLPFHKKNVFRFENFWLDFLGCHNAVLTAWNFNPHGNPMHSFSHLLSRVRSNLISWSHKGVNNIDSALIHTESEIHHLEQSDSNPNIFAILMEHYAKLSTLQLQYNTKCAQRARLLWLKDGDKNTNFFHNTIRIRSHANFISQIEDLDGNVFCSHADINSTFLNFYQNLWTAPTEIHMDILKALPSDLPRLSDSDGAHLIREVTKEEVYATLMDLPSA
ncbi:uncharacterized protein LOC120254421 [Dioscorea cayenensis subsp. rotundata]|uniref:Uncharacterized protein LOC120254421 n=1 Tax=Dioscorea cayennensis subsp. rotundata TaxID=55577 RepID=A0AB40ATM1_DIOCR|nr:uncharacterized protein LOC120254421 [Dioscorea cayenensis subsp. rotundata]